MFGGSTNHQRAFELAEVMLAPETQKRRIVIMFTDGVSSQYGNPDSVAERIRDSGGEIFCIGLLQDCTNLNKWASSPIKTHVAITEDSAGLTALFRRIGSEIVLAGAYNAVLHETVTRDFQITRINAVSHGNALIAGPQSIVWTPGTCGTAEKAETVRLSFQIRHVGYQIGERTVNKSLRYSDRDGNTLIFPSPVLQILGGGTDIYPEPCPESEVFYVPGCRDAVRMELTPVKTVSSGRIVQTDVTLKGLCPSKRVAASVILMELDSDGTEYPRGVKHFLVPARTDSICRDITLKCVRFSLPEATDATGGTCSICNSRRFALRVIADYVDTDFMCCKMFS